MAFVSGGSGGGMPPHSNNSNPNQNNQQHQLLEALLLQQHAAQQASQNQNPQNSLLGQLVANALMQNQGGNAGLQQQQQPAANLLLNVLNNQMNLNQMINPQMQQQNQTSALLQLAANPTLALYYQQMMQQNVLAQQLQQQQQQQQAVAAAASSGQSSGGGGNVMQLQQNQQQSAFQPTQGSVHQSGLVSGNVESQLNAQERLLNSYMNEQQQLAAAQLDRSNVPRNSKEMHDRINKIISDNEVIVQPQEPLLKRRPYHRQGQQSSVDHDSNSSSTRTSPGARDIRMLQTTGRTQSMYEPLSSGRIFGGSLTSGQPLIRQQPMHHTPECNYCQVAFPNEAGLQMHELRCSKRLERIEQEKIRLEAESSASLASQQMNAVSHNQVSQNSPSMEVENNSRHPLKRRLLAAANYEQQEAATPPAPPAKLQRKDSGDIIVVGETKGTPRKEQTQQTQMLGFNRRATISNIPVGSSSQSSSNSFLNQQLSQLSQLNSLMGNQTAFTQVTPRSQQPCAVTPQPPSLGGLSLVNQSYSSAATSTVSSTPQVMRISTVTEPTIEDEESPLCLSILKQVDGNLDKPYTLMLSDSSTSAQNRQVPSETTKKNRGRSITSESYVCIQRIQPMFVEHKGQLSMYRNWFQSSTREPDPRLNRFIKYFSPHPDVGVYDRYRYTIATREMVQYKVTHSSFWDLMKKTRNRNPQNDEPAGVTVEIAVEPPTQIQVVVNSPIQIKQEDLKEFSIVKEEVATTSSCETNEIKETKKEEPNDDYFEFKPTMRTINKKSGTEPLLGGHRTDEVYVYVRGRGRGRYICDTCGIRCKKPSMLKKHIRSHYDVRPYKCKQCNFSFKTKGNLTKHLGSKAHKRKVQNGTDYISDDEDDKLEIVEEGDDDMDMEVTSLTMPEDEETSDEEDNGHLDDRNEEETLRVGQENILFERNAHTPLSRWVLHMDTYNNPTWPRGENKRSTRSAPPAYFAQTGKKDEKEESPGAETYVPPTTVFGILPINTVIQQPANPTITSIPFGTTGLQQGNNVTFLNPQSTMMYNYATNEDSLKCDQCDRTFRKASELSYHQHTHILEKQNNKNRMFQCPECRLPLKTKALLAKHVETSHGSHIDDSVTASVDPSASTQSVLGGGNGQVANNPRSFMCSDCNIGFRKHGILAKHLRSKTHVMKLETLRRIPEDSLSLITKRDNGACLNEIDTADCEKARTSLLAIVDAIRSQNNQNHAMSLAGGGVLNTAAMANILAPPPVNNLECREQMAPSPVPSTMINRMVLDSNGSSAFAAQQSRCFSEANSPMRAKYQMNNDIIHRKRSDSVAMRSDPGTVPPTLGIHPNKLVSANVWVPPRQENSLLKPSDLLVSQFAPSAEMSNHNGETYTDLGGGGPLASNGSVRASPLLLQNNLLPQNPKCAYCPNQYENPLDYQVHLQVDHISVMDGQNFKCPTRFCGKVYPNKVSLRSHIISHYMNGAEFPNGDSRDDGTPMSYAAVATTEGAMRGLSPLSEGTDSTCQSPQNDPVAASSDSRPASSSEVLRLPCILCNQQFTDAAALQQHWLGHVSISTRNHVCQVCDAGFTTPDALANHSRTHIKTELK